MCPSLSLLRPLPSCALLSVLSWAGHVLGDGASRVLSLSPAPSLPLCLWLSLHLPLSLSLRLSHGLVVCASVTASVSVCDCPCSGLCARSGRTGRWHVPCSTCPPPVFSLACVVSPPFRRAVVILNALAVVVGRSPTFSVQASFETGNAPERAPIRSRNGAATPAGGPVETSWTPVGCLWSLWGCLGLLRGSPGDAPGRSERALGSVLSCSEGTSGDLFRVQRRKNSFFFLN